MPHLYTNMVMEMFCYSDQGHGDGDQWYVGYQGNTVKVILCGPNN